MEGITEQDQTGHLEATRHRHAAHPTAHRTSTDDHRSRFCAEFRRQAGQILHQFGHEGLRPRRATPSSGSSVGEVVAANGKRNQGLLDGTQRCVICRTARPRGQQHGSGTNGTGHLGQDRGRNGHEGPLGGDDMSDGKQTTTWADGAVLTEVEKRIGTVILNRPEARNALSSAVIGAVPAAIGHLEERDDVDVLILTGADPAFCAGLDLRELGDSGTNMGAGTTARGPFPSRTKPLIGAINGVAVTGGFELALCCDLLIASERARFADTHARVGVMPGWGLSVLLPQAIGVRRARELSLTGNYLDAHTAYEWGLVNRVVEHEELMPTVRSLAADIIGNDQPGVRQILRTYDRTSGVSVDDGWDVEAAMGRAWLKDSGFTPDRVAERRSAIQSRGRSQTR